MNNTFKQIAEQLNKHSTFLLFPHVSMDGDALGSCVALCKALRKMGKVSWVLIEDEIPGNIAFLDKGYCTDNQKIIDDVLDCAIAIDCGELSRFPKRADKFKKAKISICIDHHMTSEEMCDYNYICPEAAATGELIFELLKAMNVEADKEIGEAIFAAITTDTGNFQYSNTSKKSHEIIAELYDWNIDANKVSVEIYQNIRFEKMLITNRALDHIEIFGDGKIAMSYLTKREIEEVGADSSETDEVINRLRDIRGVEYACFIKEKEEKVIRVSLRAKRNGDVASIAKAIGGGGHIKAAGATLYMTLNEAKKLLKGELLKAL